MNPSTIHRHGQIPSLAKGASTLLVQVVGFVLEGQEYGLPIGQIKEVVRTLTPTRLPQAPTCIEGVANLRGRIIPIVNLRKLMGFPHQENTGQTRVMVVQAGDKEVGCLVDRMTQVRKLEQAKIQTPETPIQSKGKSFVTGLFQLEGKLLVLLDLECVLHGLTIPKEEDQSAEEPKQENILAAAGYSLPQGE